MKLIRRFNEWRTEDTNCEMGKFNLLEDFIFPIIMSVIFWFVLLACFCLIGSVIIICLMPFAIPLCGI